ncbi:hypothetical protein [Tenacibaculum sp.]|uniref:hypothetical protein n=1 Tax=Tenacibaculum sp. TaxID=1906242 RepID=UPI003AA8458B
MDRLSVKEIRKEGLKFLNFEKGIAYTFIMLLRKPYVAIQIYLFKNRRFLNNPIQYLLFSVAGYSLFINYHKGFRAFFSESSTQNKQMINSLEEQLNVTFYEEFVKAQNFYLSSMNMVYLFSIPAIALITYWFFKPKYNYAENLAIHCYMYGTANWISLIIVLLTLFLNISGSFMPVLVLLIYLVIVYLIKRVYRVKWLAALGTQLLLLLIFIIIGQLYLYGLLVYFIWAK